jgi:hypothetical protein
MIPLFFLRPNDHSALSGLHVGVGGCNLRPGGPGAEMDRSRSTRCFKEVLVTRSFGFSKTPMSIKNAQTSGDAISNALNPDEL